MTKVEKRAVLDEFIDMLYAKVGSGNGIGFTILEKLKKEAAIFCKNEAEENK